MLWIYKWGYFILVIPTIGLWRYCKVWGRNVRGGNQKTKSVVIHVWSSTIGKSIIRYQSQTYDYDAIQLQSPENNNENHLTIRHATVLFAGCSRNDECETFPSYNCSSNPLKSLTTTDCTTPRPVPCVKPNRTERVINSSPDMFADASDNDSVVEVDVSSPSYLEGIDIEAFFDDE